MTRIKLYPMRVPDTIGWMVVRLCAARSAQRSLLEAAVRICMRQEDSSSKQVPRSSRIEAHPGQAVQGQLHAAALLLHQRREARRPAAGRQRRARHRARRCESRARACSETQGV